MKEKILNRKSLTIITACLIVLLFIFLFAMPSVSFNKSELNTLNETLTQKASELKSQNELLNLLKIELQESKIKYSIDKYDNIIINDKSSSETPATLIACDYNYKSLLKNSKLISSVITMAKATDKNEIILFNNENNTYQGYLNFEKNKLSNIRRIIYLNYGNQQYISRSSFAFSENEFIIPITKTSDRFDTDINISIGGFTSSEIDSTAYKYPNLLNLISQVLNRLKNKSIDFGLSNLNCNTTGNMFPDSISLTLHINAYSVESITKYIDKRIDAFNKNYLKNFEDAYYKYEVISNKQDNEQIYDNQTIDKLYDYIYTVKNTQSRYENDKQALNGAEEGDICGISSVNSLYENSDKIISHVYIQAASDKLLKQYIKDNSQLSEILEIEFKELNKTNAFNPHPNNKLLRDINFAYIRSNNLNSKNFIIKEKTADYATPCSLLQSISGLDSIVILRMNDDSIYSITNAIINLS